MYCVYEITNTTTGRKYYGCTNNFERRRDQHLKHVLLSPSGATSQAYSRQLCADTKSGEDLLFKIIKEHESKESAQHHERDLIKSDDDCYNTIYSVPARVRKQLSKDPVQFNINIRTYGKNGFYAAIRLDVNTVYIRRITGLNVFNNWTQGRGGTALLAIELGGVVDVDIVANCLEKEAGYNETRNLHQIGKTYCDTYVATTNYLVRLDEALEHVRSK